jgi:hypothetical protein
MRSWRVGARAVLLLGMVIAGSGCVSARGYFGDRWADAKDVFTVAAGIGAGAKARVGPVHVGLIANESRVGLVSGEVSWNQFLTNDVEALCFPIIVEGGLLFSCEENRAGEDRGKRYDMAGVVPFVTTQTWSFLSPEHLSASYFTQIEVSAGLGGTLRLGFNPGELLDFFLGWFGVDIYGDDLNARREREEAEKKAREKSPAPPSPASAEN